MFYFLVLMYCIYNFKSNAIEIGYRRVKLKGKKSKKKIIRWFTVYLNSKTYLFSFSSLLIYPHPFSTFIIVFYSVFFFLKFKP
jgi:hypothetical protein